MGFKRPRVRISTLGPKKQKQFSLFLLFSFCGEVRIISCDCPVGSHSRRLDGAKQSFPESRHSNLFYANLYMQVWNYISLLQNSFQFDTILLLNYMQADYIPHMRHCQSAAPALPRDGAFCQSTGINSIRFSERWPSTRFARWISATVEPQRLAIFQRLSPSGRQRINDGRDGSASCNSPI